MKNTYGLNVGHPIMLYIKNVTSERPWTRLFIESKCHNCNNMFQLEMFGHIQAVSTEDG
jgi:hypothetical protein